MGYQCTMVYSKCTEQGSCPPFGCQLSGNYNAHFSQGARGKVKGIAWL